MIKGYQKRMICLHSPDSTLFDEAYFVLKCGEEDASEDDMVAEANRLLDASVTPPPEKRSNHRLRPLITLLIGVLLGVTLTLTAFLI